jgi:cellulase/cellobiase CelA1
MRRWIAGLAVAALTGAGIGAMAPGATADTTPTCQVTYKVMAQWSSGFSVDGIIKNTGTSSIGPGWTLAFAFGDSGQVVQLGWAIALTQSGRQVTGTNLAWNATIPAGGSLRIGFSGGLTGANPLPTAFTLNGAPCSAVVIPAGAL